MSVVAAVTLVSFVLWERKHQNPVVDVNMFKSRTFASANVMMMTLGMALYGSTVLLPQFTQVLMGYTAQQSGMALSPGGFTVILLLPFVGRLARHGVDPRRLIAFGFVSLSVSMFYMTQAPLRGHRLLHRGEAAGVPVDRAAVPVHPHQHPRVRGRPARRRTTPSRASSTCRATWAATSASPS